MALQSLTGSRAVLCMVHWPSNHTSSPSLNSVYNCPLAKGLLFSPIDSLVLKVAGAD